MRHQCTGWGLKFIFILLWKIGFPQGDSIRSGFAAHLVSEGLVNEYQFQLKEILSKESSGRLHDSLLLRLSILQFQNGDIRDSRKTFLEIEKPSLLDSLGSKYYIAMIFTEELEDSLWSSCYGIGLKDSLRCEVFRKILKRQELDSNSLGYCLILNYTEREIVRKYVEVREKSVLCGGLFSAVVPGLGKYYAGYKKQWQSAFMVNVLYGAQAVEVGIRHGVKTIPFLYAGSVFAVYYIGNIAGSMWAVKKKWRDSMTELDGEIRGYYERQLPLQMPDKEPYIGDSIAHILMDQERVLWEYAGNDSVFTELVIRKAKIYRLSGKYHKALMELERKPFKLSEDTSEESYRWVYEYSLNAFLSDDFQKATNVFEEYESRRLGKPENAAYYYALWGSLIEAENWEKCKEGMIKYLGKDDSALIKTIMVLPGDYKRKRERKARNLSKVLPGLGQAYSGHPGKGAVSFLLNAGFAGIAIFLGMHHYYVSGVVSGALPFLRFYNGNIALSNVLADKYNAKQLKDLKMDYFRMVVRILLKK